MILTAEKVKAAVIAKGYKWFTDRPNIVMIRTELDVPDTFNDWCTVTYNDGKNEVFKYFQNTTDPGLYWLQNPMNKLGTAVLVPGQYIDSHAIGFHQSKQDHEALVQVGKVKVYRNPDRTGKRDSAKSVVDEGLFGINIHGSGKVAPSKVIGKWSAGCQVFSKWSDKDEFVAICKKFKLLTKNKFTLTLINEKDLK